jgi:hypothetical protein
VLFGRDPRTRHASAREGSQRDRLTVQLPAGFKRWRFLLNVISYLKLSESRQSRRPSDVPHGAGQVFLSRICIYKGYRMGRPSFPDEEITLREQQKIGLFSPRLR